MVEQLFGMIVAVREVMYVTFHWHTFGFLDHQGHVLGEGMEGTGLLHRAAIPAPRAFVSFSVESAAGCNRSQI